MAVLNPMFIVIVIIGAFLLWCVLNNFFPSVGSVINDIGEDIKRNLSKEEKEEE